MLYRNQLFRPVGRGRPPDGLRARITGDNRIDVSLQQTGYAQVRDTAGELLQLLRDNGGFLPLNDDSSPGRDRPAHADEQEGFQTVAGRAAQKRRGGDDARGHETAEQWLRSTRRNGSRARLRTTSYSSARCWPTMRRRSASAGDVLEIGTGSGYGIEVVAPHARRFTTIDKHIPPQELLARTDVAFRQAVVPPLPFRRCVVRLGHHVPGDRAHPPRRGVRAGDSPRAEARRATDRHHAQCPDVAHAQPVARAGIYGRRAAHAARRKFRCGRDARRLRKREGDGLLRGKPPQRAAPPALRPAGPSAPPAAPPAATPLRSAQPYQPPPAARAQHRPHDVDPHGRLPHRSRRRRVLSTSSTSPGNSSGTDTIRIRPCRTSDAAGANHFN